MTRWAGATAVIIASGPSLTVNDCDLVRQWREFADWKDSFVELWRAPPRFVIAINMSYQRAPWADVLYACDDRWWKENAEAAKRDFRGEMWTQDATAAKAHGLNYIKSVRAEGLSKTPDVIHQGFNSGYQAINLAYLWGATRIVLLGYDMSNDGSKAHWHKPYKNAIVTPYEQCLQEFKRLAIDLDAAGVVVVNCTRRTALRSFELVPLEQELARPVLMMAAD